MQGAQKAERMRRSAEVVKVIDTRRVKRESADLAEVLARVPGINVRRTGGLGSDTRLTLNGLDDDQVRFFLDGVPLELMGYNAGFASVPLDLIERVEVYSGVVPVRFGADALGGVINLVSPERLGGVAASTSYEVGPFGTQRLALSARSGTSPRGAFVRSDGFYDTTDNDYPVDVEIPDASGRPAPARVRRFHDGYTSRGASVEAGVAGEPWAQRLSIRAFVTATDKDIQHNATMGVPYGEVTTYDTLTGAVLRYATSLGDDVTLNASFGHARLASRFIDAATCIYDWRSTCLGQRSFPGETGTALGNNGIDQATTRHTTFLRLYPSWSPLPDHVLRLSLAPLAEFQSGENRRLATPELRRADPSRGERSLFSFVSGVEYQLDLLDRRLQLIALAKHYFQTLRVREPAAFGAERVREKTFQRPGVGASVSFALIPSLFVKPSYEWATRLPRAQEVFGDNALVLANPELEPESSHNANLALVYQPPATTLGLLRAELGGFVRDSHQLILLLPSPNLNQQRYQNVYSARSQGIEGDVGWSAPDEVVSLRASGTWVATLNTSERGSFASFEGSQLPYRPTRFASFELRLQQRSLLLEGDEVALTGRSRWVDGFLLGWEGVGDDRYKLSIAPQLIHSAVLSYALRAAWGQLTATSEVQNLADAATYDFYGVQKPGRAFYAKVSAEL